FSLIEYLDHVDVWLNNPYAECFDWEISNSFYSSVIGSGNIYCSSHNNELLFPSGEDAYGSVSVRAKNGNCVSSWQGSSFSLWRPTLLGNFNPLRPEPLYVCVEDIPVSMINGAEFYWYFDGSLIAVTSEPSVYYWDWPCGDHVFSLVVNIGGKESLPSSTDFWGMCGGSGGWGVSSAAYPNPAGNELIIDREEKSDEIKANAAVGGQSAKASNATVKVLLYSHSTAKLVYSNDFSASAEQIRIDTSKLPNGVYYLNMIANNEKIKEQTIIVNH
ncbi:MAG: T9SS type A sorting domain-containing protein, partial [Prevotellaceae bacterium]|nr:T9SS type A sorting domain-containing protein [Prevotellaceae bacterium]